MSNNSYLIMSSGPQLETSDSEALYWRSLFSPDTLERHRAAWERAAQDANPPEGLTTVVTTVGEARGPIARFTGLIGEQLPEQRELYAEFAQLIGDAPDDATISVDYQEIAWFSSHEEFFADLVASVRATHAGDLSWLPAKQDDPIVSGFGWHSDDDLAGPVWSATAAALGYR
ncbi:hypothetical protein [Flexivirga oryzae]|uniref:Uncharacterized protein n=1 Tax=Flexivirga oryzae TaxID=1794944 RepID=A0A839N6T1_9MICO|nr:hypothetical protein [Flexivirga oryzae]MBB2890461.1 hypothetical protein [Flexivirga oryzae]